MKLGSIQYINSLPVDLGLLSKKISFPGEIVRGVPADLNTQILASRLDISPVSAFWYAQNQSRFLILPDLSISSESGVQSVLLFSRVPVRELAGKTIHTTSEGRTTPVLLEILCRKLYGFEPRLKNFTGSFAGPTAEMDACLLIGDEALTNRTQLESAGFNVMDLAEEWKRWTGFGFVFALWVVRREFAAEHPSEALRGYEAVLESKKWGLRHASEVAAAAGRQTGLSETALTSYFLCLSHDLGEGLKKGMNLYFQYARELGFLPPGEGLLFLDRNMDSAENNRYNKSFVTGEK